MVKPKVVLTGAAGSVGTQLLPALRERYEVVPVDIADPPPGVSIPDLVKVDLTDSEVDSYRSHFSGADAVVHTAYRMDPDYAVTTPRQWRPKPADTPPDLYYEERRNIDMTFHVLKLSQQEGIRRVVVTSSNHAADWYETKLHSGGLHEAGVWLMPRSDNLYGWVKIAGENLGFVFACGRFGEPVENVHIRIGMADSMAASDALDDPTTFRRDLGAYLSPNDLRQLFIKAVETPDIRNEDGIPFQVFYGISNNTRAFWSIVNARKVLGYAPQDDSEIVFADLIRRTLG